jgi:hypothetical protein
VVAPATRSADSHVIGDRFRLVADLLHALSWALWTSVVVMIFVQIWPEANRRQRKQTPAAYEAAIGRQARAGIAQTLDPPSAEGA